MTEPRRTGGALPQRARAAPRMLEALDQNIERLGEATALSRPVHVQEVLRLVDLLRRDRAGLEGLYERVPRLDEAGFFEGTPWGRMSRLLPTLVAGDLAAGGHHAVMETLSLLRVMAVIEGRIAPKMAVPKKDAADAPPRQVFGPKDAEAFLEEVVALNAWALFPTETEATRGLDPIQVSASALLFQLLVEHLPEADLLTLILDEIDQVTAQRPLLVEGLIDRVRLAERIAGLHGGEDPRLDRYVEAIRGPGPISREERDPERYRKRLAEADPPTLRSEADACSASLRRTGLACPQHAVLVRYLSTEGEEGLLDRALGLGPRGRLERRLNTTLIGEIIERGIHPLSPQAVDGLACTLERALFSRPEVAAGLGRLLDITLAPEIEQLIASSGPPGLDPLTRLMSGVLRVLGRPLGIGQGRNPTCQSARGISIWSLNRPGYLLELLATAARDGPVRMWFLGELLDSRDLMGGLMDTMHPELDPVSLVLVPHLDRLYGEMMRRVANHPEDGHKWVNPAMYGRMVPAGFESVFDPLFGIPRDIRAFVERFYLTHHPEHAATHGLVYPNPVGLVVTNAHAEFIGFHAVTIQRIARDPEGQVRVFFFNPNNEGRQDWGDGIVPTVTGHGEEPGESSLPFPDFAARLYGFHYDAYWMGSAGEVTDEEVDAVVSRIESSWVATGPWAPQMLV